MKPKYSIVWLVAVVAVGVLVSGAPASEDDNPAGASPKESVRAGFSPAKLFDFENYKILFRKTYSGLLEELVRGKYFLSRAFRAFVSAIKYKYRKASYYLAVNQMSDWTPEEIDRSRNKALAESHEGKLRKTRSVEEDESVLDQPEGDLPELLPNDVDEVKRELKRIADSVGPGAPGYEELKAVMGEAVASQSAGSQGANVRELPLERLISTGAGVHLNAETARKVATKLESENPSYKPPEFMSFGLVDEQKDVSWWASKPATLDEGSTSDRFVKAIKVVFNRISDALGNSHQPVAERAKLPDKVFLDLRETNCFNTPRYQGNCGSCWAFATISIFEWMYCMTKGKLVQFSEQYMIDCGKQYVKRIEGCEGGDWKESGHFVKNFGLELRRHYPYNARENQCPYGESTKLKETGYIRYDFNDITRVPYDELADHLLIGPIWIGIADGHGLHEYGGGVFNQKCFGRHDHAVVLVGHGREDGQEYWIMRNSWGAAWGEGGYGRIAKKAKCLEHKGALFDVRDDEFKSRARFNDLNDRRIIERRLKG